MAQVEVDEVFCLVCDEGAEVSSYDAVPGRAFSLVELCGVRYYMLISERKEG